jgi:AAA+ ATPase superfamily predicted ATPase
MERIINREHEQEILKKRLSSNMAEFIAVYGRRRVGKTYLINNFFQKKGIYFEVTGLNLLEESEEAIDSKKTDTNMKRQLEIFTKKISDTFYYGAALVAPVNWVNAFEMLKKAIIDNKIKKKLILFLDEIPWLAGKRTDFIAGIDRFWNTWASRQKNIKLIISGSAASWVINNIVDSKGGLHNRVTQTIRLLPFTLAETKRYLRYNGIKLNNKQITDIYMVTGGIPFYLNAIDNGLSAAQNINKMCFSKDGVLVGEFNKLFKSLFSNADRYEKIVLALASKREGFTIAEIAKKTGIPMGGNIAKYFENLREAGFVMNLSPYKPGKKSSHYRLSDEYSYFYLKWIKNVDQSILNDPNSKYWELMENSGKWKSWSGYAFENICFKHIPAIKKAIGISNVITTEGPWKYIPERNKYSQKGAQIDLVIDRNDNVISVCEIKYYTGKLSIDKKKADELMNKIRIFREKTKIRKSIFLVMITTEGVKKNPLSTQLIDNIVTLNDFFS